MSSLQLTVHPKELEIDSIAWICSLFNLVTSCGWWGQELNHWTAPIQPEPFPWTLGTDRTLSAPCRSCGSGRAVPSHPWSHIAGFQREPGDNRPCVSSPRGLPGWPRRLCQGAAGKWSPGESWECQWGRGHLGMDAHCISGGVGHVAGPGCRWISQREMWKNVTVFRFPGW